jgi:hypothetical protein
MHSGIGIRYQTFIVKLEFFKRSAHEIADYLRILNAERVTESMPREY